MQFRQPVKMQGGKDSTVAPVAIRLVGRLQDALELSVALPGGATGYQQE
jgi:hypothetical protein